MWAKSLCSPFLMPIFVWPIKAHLMCILSTSNSPNKLGFYNLVSCLSSTSLHGLRILCSATTTMAGQDYIKHMNEEGEFNTPQHKNKKHKKRKEIATETENHDEGKRISVRVKQIYERPDRISPIVAYFSTGYDPYALHPETGEKQTPKVTVYRHKDESKKRLKVVVSPPGANVEFVGTSYTNEQAAMQTTTNTLGVFNRETKTLKILPIACNKIIRLEPVIKTQEAIESEVSGSAVVTERSVGEQLSETISRYGTKKAASRDKKKRDLNMGDDAETKKF